MTVSRRSLDSPLSPASRPHSPWGSFDPYDSAEDQDKEYVGFAALPNQVHRKTVKKGFTFTLMVAGESGLGKSTLINSLFLTDLYKDRKIPNAEERISQTVSIVKHTVSIEEKGVKLRLSIIDTPGLGDAVNNMQSWKHLEDYVEQQFDQFFRDESGLNRRNIQDNRVHCCLYFIPPYGHGLRPLDVECMRALHEKVNIVPVLAKADSLTRAEVYKKKIKIREELRRFGINIYQFADCDSDEDEEFKRRDRLLKDSVPFAVIGSNVLVESQGRRFKGRAYPWGVVEGNSGSRLDIFHTAWRNKTSRVCRSGESGPLGFPTPAGYAGEDSHAGPEGRDPRVPLRELPGPLHPEHDAHGRPKPQAQVVGGNEGHPIHIISLIFIVLFLGSLREKYQEESHLDLPLPLADFDTEKERLIFEKDQELRRMQALLERIQEQMQSSRI
ncbi:septin-5-like isoform X1 [Syngnathus typhle]|uniref:septin-5-like isoform X1 n=1 Tax=Syngnathus typhle TaxID=161592 RepID=UPI002A6A9BD1|nr:septin-5-like isoform X1 [Syngnathus typhle]